MALRVGILGTGNIATKMAFAFSQNRNTRFVAVASRDQERARKFARGFSAVAESFGSYQELTQAPNIDVIYNALPNNQHYEWSKRALEAGKHVICEKPLCLREHQILELEKVAAANGCIIVENYLYQFHPQTEKVLSVLKSKKVNPIAAIKGEFHFIPEPKHAIRLNAILGGGAIWDIGCYPLSLAILLFDELPTVLNVNCKKLEGVDINTDVLMEFAGSKITFDLHCSFEEPYKTGFEIIGYDATLTIPRPFQPGHSGEYFIKTDKKTDRFLVKSEKDTIDLAVEGYYRIFKHKEKPLISLRHSAMICQTIEEILRRAQ